MIQNPLAVKVSLLRHLNDGMQSLVDVIERKLLAKAPQQALPKDVQKIQEQAHRSSEAGTSWQRTLGSNTTARDSLY